MTTIQTEKISMLTRVWTNVEWLISKLASPSSDIIEIGARRQAQLLAWLAIVTFITNLVGFIASISINQRDLYDSGNFGLLVVLISLICIYILSRTKFYMWGARLLVTALAMVPYITLVLDTSYGDKFVTGLYSYLPLSYIIASGLLSVWGLSILVFSTTIVTGLIPVLSPLVIREDLYTAMGTIMAGGMLLVIVVVVKNVVERDRLKNLSKLNSELSLFQDELEERVEARTQELTIAAEISQILSRERRLDHLLKNAVELVRQRFELYYAQIYLVDPSGTSLILRAGTGSVGEDLMARSHRLPIGSGSVNGLCASEKRPFIVDDVEKSPIFRPNVLLPETRSEMAMPLMIGDTAVGVLDLQSNVPEMFNEEKLMVFDVFAGQLATAIENARLFTKIQEAQKEKEIQAKRLSGEGWLDYFDGIERREYFGYVYEDDSYTSLERSLASIGNISDSNIFKAPIEVAGQKIGVIEVERAEGAMLSNDDLELVASVSRRVADQLESIRLLAQAEKFRVEAQDLARRLTRQGWEEFISGSDNTLGFVYDRERVSPLNERMNGDGKQRHVQPIEVSGEKIGEIIVDGDEELDQNSKEVIQTVVDRLSAHLDNLRLTAQTEIALSETETLYGIIAEMNAADNYQDILSAIRGRTLLSQCDTTLLCLFDRPLDSGVLVEWIIPVAHHSESDLEISARYPVSAFEANSGELFSDSPVLIQDLEKDARIDLVARTLFNNVFQARSAIVIPMILADQVIGFLAGFFNDVLDIPEADIERLVAVAGQAALAVQSQSLYERAQARARQEERIRAVTAEVFGAVDVDTVMRKAVEQVGQALGRPAYIYLGQESSGNGRSEE